MLMEVHYVTNNYDSGDHEKGYYRSPLFATKELAEAFLAKIGDEWDHEIGWGGPICKPHIVTEKINTELVEPSDKDLHIVYT